MKRIGSYFNLLKTIACFVLLCYPSYTFSQTVKPSEDANNLFKAGVEAFNSNRYKKAAELFKAATEKDSDFAEAYGNWGTCLSNLGQHKEASEKYKKAFEASGIIEENLETSLYAANVKTIFPWIVKNYFFWGRALYELGRYEEAVNKFEKAELISLAKGPFIEPQEPPASFYKIWGNALKKLGRKKEADGKLKKAK